MKYILKFGLYVLSVFTLSACSGPFADYSDNDLREEFRKCDFDRLSPAGAQRCLNIQKECEARKKDRGLRC